MGSLSNILQLTPWRKGQTTFVSEAFQGSFRCFFFLFCFMFSPEGWTKKQYIVYRLNLKSRKKKFFRWSFLVGNSPTFWIPGFQRKHRQVQDLILEVFGIIVVRLYIMITKSYQEIKLYQLASLLSQEINNNRRPITFESFALYDWYITVFFHITSMVLYQFRGLASLTKMAQVIRVSTCVRPKRGPTRHTW